MAINELIDVNPEFKPSLKSALYLTRRNLLIGISEYAPYLKGRILDFGCGSKPYKSFFADSEYIGVDFHGDGHDHTEEQIDYFYDGKTLPFANESFDAVFSSEVFEHVFNLDEILVELYRVVKQNGMMLITCPFSICEHEQPNDFARYSSFGIRYLLEKHGFEIVHQIKLGSAIETLWQLRITYWNLHVLSKFKNIPVVRTGMRVFVNITMNAIAIFCNAIFPKSQDLYLNNLVLVKKSYR